MRRTTAAKPISSKFRLSGGKVTSAIMCLITGGKDLPLVSKMCAKYGLDPNKSS